MRFFLFFVFFASLQVAWFSASPYGLGLFMSRGTGYTLHTPDISTNESNPHDMDVSVAQRIWLPFLIIIVVVVVNLSCASNYVACSSA